MRIGIGHGTTESWHVRPSRSLDLDVEVSLQVMEKEVPQPAATSVAIEAHLANGL